MAVGFQNFSRVLARHRGRLSRWRHLAGCGAEPRVPLVLALAPHPPLELPREERAAGPRRPPALCGGLRGPQARPAA